MSKDHDSWETNVDIMALLIGIIGMAIVIGIAFSLGIPQAFFK